MGGGRADDPGRRATAPGGRPRKAEKREIVEAILYLLRAGCASRLLPHDFPPWQTVYHYVRRREREGVWAGALHTLVMADRERAGREASSSAAILDSRAVRTADQRGTQRIRRRKTHPWPRAAYASTDTDGRLLAVEVHGADVQDRDGAKGVRKRPLRRFPFVERVFADGGYAGKLVFWAKDKTHVVLGIVRRMPWMKGFVVIRRRWVVERTFAWTLKCRRLARGYEQLTRTSETLITIAAIATLVGRRK